jgi:hypothetical protein
MASETVNWNEPNKAFTYPQAYRDNIKTKNIDVGFEEDRWTELD